MPEGHRDLGVKGRRSKGRGWVGVRTYRRAVQHRGHEDVVPGAVDERHVSLQLPGLPVLLEAVAVVTPLGPAL